LFCSFLFFVNGNGEEEEIMTVIKMKNSLNLSEHDFWIHDEDVAEGRREKGEEEEEPVYFLLLLLLLLCHRSPFNLFFHPKELNLITSWKLS